MTQVSYQGWNIKETSCYPCRYKVSQPGYQDDNATWRYHRTINAAKVTINRIIKCRDSIHGGEK